MKLYIDICNKYVEQQEYIALLFAWAQSRVRKLVTCPERTCIHSCLDNEANEETILIVNMYVLDGNSCICFGLAFYEGRFCHVSDWLVHRSFSRRARVCVCFWLAPTFSNTYLFETIILVGKQQ